MTNAIEPAQPEGELRTVGIVSPGDMGHGLSRLFVAGGLRLVTCLAGRSERTVALAADAGIEPLPTLGDVVREADLFLSLVPPAQALGLAGSVAEALEQAGSSLLYADCNSIAPRTVESVAQLVIGVGARFVDVSIIGTPPRPVAGGFADGPRVYASGDGAIEFAQLRVHGLDISVLDRGLTRASSLKMCYAALLKGLTALSTELMVTSELLDVREPLRDQLETTQPALLAMMGRQVPSMPPKARRWVGEMEQMAITFADAGLPPNIFEGAAALFNMVARTALGEETVEDRRLGTNLDEVVDTLAGVVRVASAERQRLAERVLAASGT